MTMVSGLLPGSRRSVPQGARGRRRAPRQELRAPASTDLLRCRHRAGISGLGCRRGVSDREPPGCGALLQPTGQAGGSTTRDRLTQPVPESGPTVCEEALLPFWSERADGWSLRESPSLRPQMAAQMEKNEIPVQEASHLLKPWAPTPARPAPVRALTCQEAVKPPRQGGHRDSARPRLLPGHGPLSQPQMVGHLE